ncbi:substrate-binding domain-containing protein [Blastococcus sp. TF02-8]|uniref:substrate-binding domain-containing protein n=1 Tax=Blastococcus sp. TF02-8 TaxID=2250574 RepID=UPI001F0BA5E1|nr:substrate-binding domain-containing protein [Blastococcus sp. TF02-8]
MPPVLLAAGLAVLLLLGGGIWWATSGGCGDRTTVDVTVAPELGGLAEELLSDVAKDEDLCVDPVVTAQEPLQTAGDLGALDADALPDVWVPDSSLWTARTDAAGLESAGSMALSPVVLATSRSAVEELGWSSGAPSWSEALSTGRPLAVPDLAASAEGLSALAAVRAALGGDEDADNAVVQAVLAAARSAVPSPAEALAAGGTDDADAPLVPVSEQEVYAANGQSTDHNLVAVYPSEGTPSLDYPVLRVGSPSGEAKKAVDAVVRRLLSEDAQVAVRDAGFRGPQGDAPPRAGGDSGITEGVPQAMPLEPASVTELLGRLSSLAAPSRLLAVFDVSKSMEAPVGEGNRATLARDAAKSALSLFPDNSAIGLWVFARRLDGDADWVELEPIRALDADANGEPQREKLQAELDTIPGRLSPGGTGLYDTALAAVRAARADFDPRAVSSVVLITDGKDEDEGSIGIEELVRTLEAEKDPDRPVKVIGIALGPDADLGALERITAATGGGAYSAVDENDLQTVLFDALRKRG